jgi:hypothetical protein
MPRAENHLNHSFTDKGEETYTACPAHVPHLIELSSDDSEGPKILFFREDVERIVEILRKAAATYQ